MEQKSCHRFAFALQWYKHHVLLATCDDTGPPGVLYTHMSHRTMFLQCPALNFTATIMVCYHLLSSRASSHTLGVLWWAAAAVAAAAAAAAAAARLRRQQQPVVDTVSALLVMLFSKKISLFHAVKSAAD
jgi:hypothetical protein